MEVKSLFAGAKSYSVKITKSFMYDDYDEAKLNIEITDPMASVEGYFTGAGCDGIEVRIKYSSDYCHKGEDNGVDCHLEIENVNDCQCFKIETTPDEVWKNNIKGFHFSFAGAWELCAIENGLRIVMETMDKVIREVAKWK